MNLINISLLWTLFIIIIVIGLSIDLGFLNKIKNKIIKNKKNTENIDHHSKTQESKQALIWTIAWISLALAFSGLIYLSLGYNKFLEYLTGYVLEKSLSVDNMFVFSLIFASLAIPHEYQHRVLSVGIISAILMRIPLIFVGSTLLEEFHFMIYIFGGILIYTALKIIISKKDTQVNIDNHIGVKLLRKLIPVTTKMNKHHFFEVNNKIRYATPLLVTLVIIEISDLLFAIDSIPAILAITSDPLILITSNVFAILGLRSLYFLLAGIMTKFIYFHQVLIFLLLFIGIKMVISEFYKIPTETALVVILAALTASIIASYIKTNKQKKI